MKTLTVITSRFPYPLDKGDKLRIYYQLESLSRHFKVRLICLSEQIVNEERKKILEHYCDELHVFHIPRFKRYIRVMLSLINGKNMPAQVAYFYDPKIARSIGSLVKETNSDFYYCQLIRVGEYLREITSPICTDLMDAFAYGAEKRAENVNGIRKWFWNREAQLIRNYEKRLSESCQQFCIISEADKERIQYLNIPVSVINNGISSQFYDHEEPESTPKYDLVFVGNLGYYPNQRAVTYLDTRIIPKYRKLFGESLKINIAGPNSDKLNLTNAGINLGGFYEDVRNAYHSGEIFIAPLFDGMGQQNKILEAIALRKPCVVSPEVARGLDLVHKEHVLIANNPEEFCRAIKVLKLDQTMRQKMIAAAHAFIVNNYSWESSNSKLVRLIQAMNS